MRQQRRQWQPTPVLWPGKSHGRSSLVGYSPWGRTRLRDITFTFHFHALEKEMAPHSSVLEWRIPGTEEPGGLQSITLHRVWHDWSDLAAAAVASEAGLSSIKKHMRKRYPNTTWWWKDLYIERLSICWRKLTLQKLRTGKSLKYTSTNI